MVRACFLSTHSFNEAKPWSFLGTPDLLQTLVLCPAQPGRLVTAPFLPSGDNKPIWMHAEEREESKVAVRGRAGVGVRGGGRLGGVGRALLSPPAYLSPRISAGTAHPMGNMVAGTRPAK